MVYLTASFNALPALNLGTRLAGISTASPVCGLRPMRSARSLVLNVPKPIMATSPPCESASITLAQNASSASPALAYDSPARSAICLMSSDLFMVLLLLVKF